MARMTVHVVPRSMKPGPDGYHGDLPRLRLASTPTDGKANAEAERVLTTLLGVRVTLAAGAKSRRKTFEVALDADELAPRISAIFG
jgi:uncharacterized protein YggU (UPF0235/DUF167 family)